LSKPLSKRWTVTALFFLTFGVLSQRWIGPVMAVESPYSRWTNGPPTDPSFFPIGVWLQDPMDAKAYKVAGINLYVGLWKGPTKEQLSRLKLAKMPVICEQNEIGLTYQDEKIILGWMHGDEPDNAQPLPLGIGYGFPVPPKDVKTLYQSMKEADSSRPVLLNLGQGVAWDGWWGRGPRSGHPEDYPLYVQGCDIASFDIYPAMDTHPAVSGNLWYVAEGVKRLIAASDPPKIVWNVIEAAGGHTGRRPTPHQVRTEVWMSIIHGSRGILYFVHEWKPEFCSRVLLEDVNLFKGVQEINAQIHHLASVINSPDQGAEVGVVSSNPEVPLAALEKHSEGTAYLFTAAMRDSGTTGTFKVPPSALYSSAEVLGESRTLQILDGTFSDEFKGYAVHLYHLKK
jgi:hypothetical protein